MDKVQNKPNSSVQIFLYSTVVIPVLGPTKWVLAALYPGIKRLKLEADHSLPTNAEIKETWICTSTPPYVFMA
jgi:hypothetical protein